MKTILINTDHNKNITIDCKNKEKYLLVIDQEGEYFLQFNFSKPSIKAEIFGLVVGSHNRIVVHTKQLHNEQKTVSVLKFKSILFPGADFEFNGTIRMEKNAPLANAYQRNDNLLISDTATCKSRPVLEILTDNISCTHGATTGSINEEQLFYLKTRGLSEKSAKNMLTLAFVNDFISNLQDENLRDKIVNKLNQLYG